MKVGSYGKKQKNRGRERLKVKTSPPVTIWRERLKTRLPLTKRECEGNTEKQSFPHRKTEGGEH